MQQIDSNYIVLAKDSLINRLPTFKADTIESISLFSDHILKVNVVEPIPFPDSSFGTYFYWLIGISLIIAIAKISFFKQFSLSILSNFSNRKFSLLQQLGSTIRHQLNVILLLAFFLSSAVLLSFLSYQYVDNDIYSVNDLIIQNISLISSVVIATISIAEIFRYVYQIDTLVNSYYATILQSYNLLSVSFTLLLWALLFSGSDIGNEVAFAIIGLLFLLRFYNILINTNMKNNYSLLHYIIYLCTVEIIPMIIAAKLYSIMVLDI